MSAPCHFVDVGLVGSHHGCFKFNQIKFVCQLCQCQVHIRCGPLHGEDAGQIAASCSLMVSALRDVNNEFEWKIMTCVGQAEVTIK